MYNLPLLLDYKLNVKYQIESIYQGLRSLILFISFNPILSIIVT